MSTPLANPRRTRLATWPTRHPQDQDAEQTVRTGDAVPSAPDEEQVVS
ncbi:hypothetical protein [Actinomadura flavalba]|nr:hypothetical protein [Actinomadura flavalba]